MHPTLSRRMLVGGALLLTLSACVIAFLLSKSISVDGRPYWWSGLLVIWALACAVLWWSLRQSNQYVASITRDIQAAAQDLGDSVHMPDSAHAASELRGAVGGLITALRRTFKKVRREKERLTTILESMEASVLVVSDQGRLKLVNEAARSLFRLQGAVKGRRLTDVIETPILNELVQQTLHNKSPHQRETVLDDYEPRQVIIRANPLKARPGCMLVIHDVTELRHLERVRRDFVANVSHDLKTPVSVIRANAETLLDSALSDPIHARRFVEGILRNSERLSAQIEEILYMARLEGGEAVPSQRISLSVRDSVSQVLESLDTVLQAPAHRVVVEVPPYCQVVADPNAFSRALANLLENAVKYTPAPGIIHVGASQVQQHIEIQVDDNGPGIPPEHRQRVFERFYRLDPARARSTGGSGLGLAIVKHLVRGMGGEVGTGESPLGGARFWIRLPLSIEDQPARRPATPPSTYASVQQSF